MYSLISSGASSLPETTIRISTSIVLQRISCNASSSRWTHRLPGDPRGQRRRLKSKEQRCNIRVRITITIISISIIFFFIIIIMFMIIIVIIMIIIVIIMIIIVIIMIIIKIIIMMIIKIIITITIMIPTKGSELSSCKTSSPSLPSRCRDWRSIIT